MIGERPRESLGSQQLAALAVACVAAVAGAAVLYLTGSQAFEPYFGTVNPVVGTGAIVLLGMCALGYLHSGGWLYVDRPRRGPMRFALPGMLASAVAIPVILVDLAGGFPRDLNVLPPESWLFYPVIALVAETVFHVAPAALLVSAAARLAPAAERTTVLAICLLVVATPEPVFQVVASVGESPWWANAYVALHLLIFNLAAVYLFSRNGFFSMLIFRLTYYLLWHIVWGPLRLRVLF